MWHICPRNLLKGDLVLMLSYEVHFVHVWNVVTRWWRQVLLLVLLLKWGRCIIIELAIAEILAISITALALHDVVVDTWESIRRRSFSCWFLYAKRLGCGVSYELL